MCDLRHFFARRVNHKGETLYRLRRILRPRLHAPRVSCAVDAAHGASIPGIEHSNFSLLGYTKRSWESTNAQMQGALREFFVAT